MRRRLARNEWANYVCRHEFIKAQLADRRPTPIDAILHFQQQQRLKDLKERLIIGSVEDVLTQEAQAASRELFTVPAAPTTELIVNPKPYTSRRKRGR